MAEDPARLLQGRLYIRTDDNRYFRLSDKLGLLPQPQEACAQILANLAATFKAVPAISDDFSIVVHARQSAVSGYIRAFDIEKDSRDNFFALNAFEKLLPYAQSMCASLQSRYLDDSIEFDANEQIGRFHFANPYTMLYTTSMLASSLGIESDMEQGYESFRSNILGRHFMISARPGTLALPFSPLQINRGLNAHFLDAPKIPGAAKDNIVWLRSLN